MPNQIPPEKGDVRTPVQSVPTKVKKSGRDKALVAVAVLIILTLVFLAAH